MKKGFTLVELLAVIVILAIILVIAVPGISGLLQSSTRGTFESNAKLVLTAVNYKILEDSSFDPTTVNEANMKSLLNLDDSNVKTLTVKKINDTLVVTIVGKNKWDNLTVSGTQSTARVDDTITALSNGANKPVLATGMTPVKWNGSSWVDTTESDSSWYNYNTANKQWANARTADGSMWVWIPRYIYKISSGWHTATVGTIDVQFTKGIDDNWNKSVIGNIDVGETSNASNNKWTNHPAFTFGSTELTGIWVAKFEASAPTNNVCYTTPNTTNCDVTTIAPNFVPNVISWRYASVGTQFAAAHNIEVNAKYGWGTTGNGIDSHMMKNTEWGAVAYLTQSSYGKNAEIWINNSGTFTTGCAGNSVSEASYNGCQNVYSTANGVQASTTGNIYGIYDLSGGAWEYVAAYVDDGHSYLTAYGSNILSAEKKYKNVYVKSTTDTPTDNYALAINSKGDAIYETSSVGTGYMSWNGDWSYMLSNDYPWLGRGSCHSHATKAGSFNYSGYNGPALSYNSFRATLLVNEGL